MSSVSGVTRCSSSLSGQGQPVVSALFSSDGDHLASGSGDKTLFHGYDSDEIKEAELNRPRIYDSEEENFVPEYKLVTKPRSKAQVVSPPSILAGRKSRLKVYLLEKYPSRELGNSKLPKAEKVLLCFFDHLLQNPDRMKNNNKWTEATDDAVKAACKSTIEDIKDVYRLHFGSELVDDEQSKMIMEDKNIVPKIKKLFDDLKTIEREE